MPATLHDDMITGAGGMAAYLFGDDPKGERRVRNFIERSDKAADDDPGRFPVIRRGGLLISFKSWLSAWSRGEPVVVPRGDPKTPGRGRPPRQKAVPPPASEPRISARTGQPVRKYVRRSAEAAAEP